MLLENILQEKYIEYLKSKKIPFEYEANILNGAIDFKIELEGKFLGVQAKADRSCPFSALGELMNARRTFSDVYLLSTEKFYHILYEILSEFGLQDSFGFIILKNGEFVTVSKPKHKEYYFNEKHCNPRKRKKTKTFVIGEEAVRFLERRKDGPFFVFDVAKEMKNSMPHAQKRVARWRRLGLVEEIPHAGVPKPFRVLKIPKEKTSTHG